MSSFYVNFVVIIVLYKINTELKKRPKYPQNIYMIYAVFPCIRFQALEEEKQHVTDYRSEVFLYVVTTPSNWWWDVHSNVLIMTHYIAGVEGG